MAKDDKRTPNPVGDVAAAGTSAGPSPKNAAKSRGKSPTRGDVYEFKLTDGRLAYLQYVNDDVRPPPGFGGYGNLVRVLSGSHDVRPADPARLAEQAGEQFLIFLHIPSAVRQKVLERVGAAPVPERLQRLPRFKSVTIHPHTKNRTFRSIDPAKGMATEQLGNKLPRAMLDDPLTHLANMPGLVEFIECGWTHSAWVRPEDIAD